MVGTSPINVKANRASRKWTPKQLLGRLIWELVRTPVFAWSPRPLWFWRRTILRIFGAKIGPGVRIFSSVKIAIPWNLTIGEYAAVGDGAILYSLGTIEIGPSTTISQYAHLCAGSHDHQRSDFPLAKLPIKIGAEAWVCADAFIGPGVSVGNRAIVGARAVAMRDINNSAIMVGNPATQIGTRDTKGRRTKK
ncbi:colanic acid biosynthesis acetyltransferase WcaF [Algimonas arctica]|uniref:Colanic acid biosynthesis acetyltransferase WcaF n=1 Tax=Algimonas arctica TaxID=1479486 RepID=A0A8J3CQB0_9PROT|nr:putative colanic acid biosynthesis acetyltransferase [Algimonas arctica]GHA85133.1 colanic acid biosynthesis acetyltransferase WcaF [Algimonas arctica]